MAGYIGTGAVPQATQNVIHLRQRLGKPAFPQVDIHPDM